MKLIDSNVFIFAFSNNPRKENCREVLRKENLITNTLVVIEVFAKLSTIVDKEYANTIVKELYRLDNLRIVDMDKNLLFDAMKKGKTNLSISDAIHYTTALANSCEAIVSYDKDFDGLEIPREEP